MSLCQEQALTVWLLQSEQAMALLNLPDTKPQLRFDILKKLKQTSGISIVLHGIFCSSTLSRKDQCTGERSKCNGVPKTSFAKQQGGSL